MIVSEQKPVKFINSCCCLVDYGELEEAILWYQKRPTISIKKIYIYGRYPAVSIHSEKIHIHRLLMMFWLKAKIPSDYIVHHIDGNKLNATKENLSLLHTTKHQSIHNKGKTLTEEHRLKLSEKNRLRKGLRHRPTRQDVLSSEVYRLRQSGMSFNQISKKFKLDWVCVKQRYSDYVHDNPELLKGANE